MDSLKKAVEKADEISKKMRGESKKALALQKDIGTLREKFETLEPDWESKLSMAAENVSEIQSNLLKAKNSLTKVESEAGRVNLNFKMANASLASNLQNLRDKIAKAKHAAEGVG